MHDYLFDALHRLKTLYYLLFAALRQYLDLNIIGYHLPLNQLAEEVIFYLAGCGKAYFYFLKAQLYQKIKKLYFLRYYHRVNKSLITIPQVHTAPYRRFLDLLIRPCSFRITVNWNALVTFVI